MSISEVLQNLQRRAAQSAARVLLADSNDPRSVAAAALMVEQNIASPVLIGERSEFDSIAQSLGVSLNGVECLSWQHCNQEQLIESYYQKRAHKGITREEATRLVQEPLILAGMLLDQGMVDCCVAGSTSSTAAVLRAALQTIPLAQGVSTLSSYFLMVLSDKTLVYADCAVVPNPTAEQLCDIAASSAANYRLLMQEEPRVAFLSFSTKGSAEHEMVLKVREATELFQKKYPHVIADGELQADAALVSSVAQRKARGAQIQGDANVLIFPSLDAGNIAYKLSERLAQGVALGPIIQGLSKPYCDLSRGCTVEDIVNTACIAVLMGKG